MCALISERHKHELRQKFIRAVRWSERRLPPGLRSLLGIVLVIAGIFGFLPVLGFWMVPLGALFIALDIPPLRRRLRHWLDASEAENQRKP